MHIMPRALHGIVQDSTSTVPVSCMDTHRMPDRTCCISAAAMSKASWRAPMASSPEAQANEGMVPAAPVHHLQHKVPAAVYHRLHCLQSNDT
jgi:hypothetical protein